MAEPYRVAAIELPAPDFETFTYPRYRPVVRGAAPEDTGRPLAIGAWAGGIPAGLALFSLWPNARGRLLSILVSAPLRGHGLAGRMLALGEAAAAADGVKKLVALHSSRMPRRESWEALLRKSGWSAPAELEFRLAGRARWSIQAAQDWAPFLARLAERGYGSSPWNEISPADRARVAAMVTSELSEADRSFDPFKAEKALELIGELSLVLRRHGEIVGWIVASRGALPGSVHYSNGYVLPALRRAGWLVAGVREVCERQSALLGRDSLSIFETAPGNQAMRRFMERQLKPYSEWTDTRYRSEKAIG
ncbi:MAG: GNAT family N-acetyltransferase [Betaproteobacteria bacterium]